jgi:hypothetical protein
MLLHCLLLSSVFHTTNGRNGSAPSAPSFAPFASSIVRTDTLTTVSPGPPVVAIGSGRTRFGDVCVASVNQMDGSRVCTSMQLSAQSEGCIPLNNSYITVLGSGTMFIGTATDVWCCVKAEVTVAVTDDDCKPAVLFAEKDDLATHTSITVGSVSQLHRVDTHILVAEFMASIPPYFTLVPGFAAGALYMVATNCPAENSQSRLDACKITFVVSLLSDVAIYAWLLLSKEFSWTMLDPVTFVSKVGELIAATAGVVWKPCFRTYHGESKGSCAAKGTAVATGSFASFGTVAAVVPIVQSALNACMRRDSVRLPHAGNVRP